jgi:IS605 OrfB family transposase
LELHPTPDQALLLTETSRQFTGVFNHVCRVGWQQREKHGVRLHHDTYYPLKVQFPALVSDLHIQARVKATEAVKAALALARQGRQVSCPTSRLCPPRFNVHTFKLSWERSDVRLATTGGRITVPFSLAAYAGKYRGSKVCTADLLCRDGRWFLHVVVALPAPETTGSAAIIGVDLGLAQPAVTSNAKFLGQRRWRELEARQFRLKRQLQKAGTKAAKRRLKKLKGKQRCFRRDCDHVLSKQLVHATPPGATIVVENLTHIRRRIKQRRGPQSRRVHGWSFAQLRSFIAYKAEERGGTVVGVDSRHTSQQCSCCGHVARNNRRSRSVFRCRVCGFELHADLNGARNVAAKYHAGRGKAPSGGFPSERLSFQPPTSLSEAGTGLGTSSRALAGGV